MGLLPVPGEGSWVQQGQEEQEGAPRPSEVEAGVRRALLQQRCLPLPEEGPQEGVGAPRLCPPWEVSAERVEQQ